MIFVTRNAHSFVHYLNALVLWYACYRIRVQGGQQISILLLSRYCIQRSTSMFPATLRLFLRFSVQRQFLDEEEVRIGDESCQRRIWKSRAMPAGSCR